MNKMILPVKVKIAEKDLSAKERTFNKLIIQLEKAHQNFEKTKQSLDEKRDIAEKSLRPIFDQYIQAQLRMFELYVEELKGVKSKTRRELFARFILNEIDGFMVLPCTFTEKEEFWLEEISKKCESIAYKNSIDSNQLSMDECHGVFYERCDPKFDSFARYLF